MFVDKNEYEYEEDELFEAYHDPEFGFMLIKHANQNDIDELSKKWPDNLNEIIVQGDYVDEINVPDGVESFTCTNVPVRKLTLPDSLKRLYCDGCLLKELILPSEIEKVVASDNWISKISFRSPPVALQELHVQDNRLTRLIFDPPETLEAINTANNRRRPLAITPLLEKKIIDLDHQPEKYHTDHHCEFLGPLMMRNIF